MKGRPAKFWAQHRGGTRPPDAFLLHGIKQTRPEAGFHLTGEIVAGRIP